VVPRRQKRRVKHQEKIWHFMPEPERPYHNNQSEGAIRMFKVKQKYPAVSGVNMERRGLRSCDLSLKPQKTTDELLAAIQSLTNGTLSFSPGQIVANLDGELKCWWRCRSADQLLNVATILHVLFPCEGLYHLVVTGPSIQLVCYFFDSHVPEVGLFY